MKRLYCILAFICFSFLGIAQNNVSTQDTIKKTAAFSFNVSADIVSRYIFRGTDFGDAPAIQPTLALNFHQFELGCWSSFSTYGFYREADLYLKYNSKYFSITFTDYYIPSMVGTPASSDTRYFIYNDKKTAHTLEGSLMVKGSEKFPLWLQGNLFFYGNDKRWGYKPALDTLEKTYYSSYIEMGGTFAIKPCPVSIFLGFTPAAGAYGNAPGFVHCGLTATKTLSINKDLEIPIKGSLIFNPQASKVYAVLGFSL